MTGYLPEMAFSDDEIQSVVEQLSPGGARRGYDALGVLRVSNSLSKVQRAAAGVLLLYPSVSYYYAYLAADALLGDTRAAAAACAELHAAVGSLRRRSVPVSDVSAISNARAALVELESVVTSANPPKDMASVPSLSRFSDNVDRFLRKVASNIRQNNQIVYTPEESRKRIPTLLDTVKSSLPSLRQKVVWISESEDDLHNVNLPQTVSGEVVQNARKALAARELQLAEASPSVRLEVIRETVLELLAVKGVVTKFTSFPPASSGLEVFGTGTLHSDTAHPAVGGTVTMKRGPYLLVRGATDDTSNNVLYLWLGKPTPIKSDITATLALPLTFTRATGNFLLDGVNVGCNVYVGSGPDAGKMRRVSAVTATTVVCEGDALTTPGSVSIKAILPSDLSFYLPPTPPPRLLGVVSGPYAIVAATNDQLRFSVNGAAAITPALTAGVARTADQVAADITAGLLFTPFKAEAYYLPTTFEGTVVTAAGDVSLPYGNFPLLMNIGDSVKFIAGPNAGQVRTITALLPSPSAYNKLSLSGGALTVSTRDRVEVGNKQSLRVVPKNVAASLAAGDSISILPVTGIQQQTGATIGIYGQQQSIGRPTDAQTLSDILGVNNNKVTSSVVFTSYSSGHSLRTEPSDGRIVVARRSRGSGTWSSGTAIVITDTARVGIPVIGDKVVLRGGVDDGRVGTVTAVTSTTTSATFSPSVGAGVGAAYEVGAALPAAAGDAVRITAGVNAGRYVIEKVHATIPFQFQLRDVLPQYKNFSVGYELDGSVGYEAVTITNADTAVGASISLFDPTGALGVSVLSGPTYGTTKYFKTPQTPTQLGVDDVLDLYLSGNTVTPAYQRTITELSGNILTLDAAVPTTTTSFTMGGAAVLPTPSAVLRNGRNYDFKSFADRLRAWAASAVFSDLPRVFLDLDRKVTTLLRSDNPSNLECADVEQSINEVLYLLTATSATAGGRDAAKTLEAILSSYYVDRETEADNLLRSYKELGADRALDLLLSCRFSEFFGCSTEELSYSGALQKGVRELAMNDLPISKFDRDTRSQVYSTAQDTDFEFSSADLNESAQVDPPQ